MKLLLHICCAPCLIYPLGCFQDKGFAVTGFFNNPNIHSFSEYNKRKEALADFIKAAAIGIIYTDYAPGEFFRAIHLKEDKARRCAICWRLRLIKAAQTAKEKGFDCFSTTLLVSPYQDHELLKEIGTEISKELNLPFYYEDFRPGFRKAQEIARQIGLYRQKYCGCIYSEMERRNK